MSNAVLLKLGINKPCEPLASDKHLDFLVLLFRCLATKWVTLSIFPDRNALTPSPLGCVQVQARVSSAVQTFFTEQSAWQ